MKTPLRTVLKNFLDHVDDLEARRKLCDDQYEVEFQRLKQLTEQLRIDPEYSCIFGQKEENRLKNRYKDIVPYDFCRVVLPEYAGVPGSEYINASYIKGGSGAFAYIAAQGPLSNTVIDFWRMVWFCDVQVIVMACSEQEGGKIKCVSYWPLNEEIVNFGKISVKLVSQKQVCPDFLVRNFVVKLGSESREIWQFHYNTWPDHSVPDTVQPILHLVRLVRELQASETAPILVHCSAGCGRTGTICAIDFIWACLRTGKLDETFSLHDIVSNMRRQRIAMVQTKEQYMLVYKAVAEMFMQQLKIIDSHIYENLDKSGHPISMNGHRKNKVLELRDSQGLVNTSVKETVSLKFNDIQKKEMRPEDPWIKQEDLAGNEVLPESRLNLVENEALTYQPPNKESLIPTIADSTDASKKLLIPDIETKANELGRSVSSDQQRPEETCTENKLGNTTTAMSILNCPSSAESIPYIDDDDSKSEIHVRTRCGRAYLHIPSCDSISKIVNRFDPFVDVFHDTDSSPDIERVSIGSGIYIGVSQKCNNTDVQINNSNSPGAETSSLKTMEPAAPNKNIPNSPTWSSVSQSDVESKNSVFIADSECSDVTESQICSAQISKASSSEGSDGKNRVNSNTSAASKISRRPSIARLKGLFEKSSKNKNDDRPTLFRHHSHHVSRAGSAPPSLSSMNKESDKESVFGIMSRKFRSSSVKSEQEIKREEAKTLTLRSLKKSAVTSISHIRQNISNFSRNMQAIWPKSQSRSVQNSHTTWHDTNRSSTRSERISEPLKMAAKDTGVRDKSLKRDKGAASIITSCLPRSVHTPDNIENTQQRFIVNILSSGHSPIATKKYDMPSAKPVSPKTRAFPVDFDCLKVKAHNTSETKETSKDFYTFWNQTKYNDPIPDRTKGGGKDIPPLTVPCESTQMKTKKAVVTEEKSLTLSCSKSDSNATPSTTAKTKADSSKPFTIKTKSVYPNSKFHVMTSESQSVSPEIEKYLNSPTSPDHRSVLGIENLAVAKGEDVGNSKFFWPLSSNVAVKVDCNEAKEKEDGSKLKLSSEKPQGPKQSDRALNIENSLSQIAGESAISISSEDYVQENHGMMANRKELQSSLSTNPPALPKKTVIGKNREQLEGLLSVNFKVDEKLPITVAEVQKVASQVQERHISDPEKKTEIPDCIIDNSQNRDDKNLYINVNSVTKKNIEQIENTLRTHPRGAIIDLTSRQSYSMDEELASAVSKLPEPTKAKITLHSSHTSSSKPPGYEVIWPTTSSENNNVKNSLENRNSQKDFNASKNKKSGVCYSPPLRRQVMNFPVMKSHSCASLAWQQSEMQFIGDDDEGKQDFKSDSAETLVSEAVVELSTMLDELTTKTLSDDLSQLLDVPKDGEKQPMECMDRSDISDGERTSCNSDASSGNQFTSMQKFESRVDSVNIVHSVDVHEKHVMSLKNPNDEEIIFHFPPPPSVPPPEVDAMCETFDVFCKNGILKVVSGPHNQETAEPNALSTVSLYDEKDSPVNRKQNPFPIPLPRKTRNSSNMSSEGIRKSASYTTLPQQFTWNPDYENVTLEKCKTLPRSITPDKTGDSTFSQSSSTNNLLPSETVCSKSTQSSGHKYEVIYPIKPLAYKSQAAVLADEFKLSLFPQPQKESNLSQPCKLPVSRNSGSKLVEDYKLSLFGSRTSGSSESNIAVTQESKAALHSRTQSAKLRLHPRTRPKEESCSTNHENKQTQIQLSESIHDRVKASFHRSAQSIDGAEVNIFNKNTSDQDSKFKRSRQPSRKTQHAPLPPLLTTEKLLENTTKIMSSSQSLISEQSQKRSPSRKAAKAPDPPKLQKSASMKIRSTSRVASNNSEEEGPIYAMVQKPKLHAVLENISDSQCAIPQKDSVKVFHRQKDVGQSRNYGLQHSHSDASIFLALRNQKYQSKNNIQSFRKPSGSVQSKINKSSLSSSEGNSSSSESDNSSFTINCSDEQKLKSVSREKRQAPVAPPRVKRRTTTEVHYIKNIQSSSSNNVSLSSSEHEEPVAPRVPAKSRGAFEVPDDIKSRDKHVGVSKKSVQLSSRSLANAKKNEMTSKPEKSPVVYRKC